MLSVLTLFAFLVFGVTQGQTASLPPSEELRSFAHSPEWLHLYNYEKKMTGFKSKASEKAFFFSKEGRTRPLKELKSAIKAFRTIKKEFGHTKLQAQCAFPARYQRVKQQWPNYFSKDLECPSFKSWKKDINTQSLSIMYVGPYPNNPASMFGHTLLRFKRGKGSWLLDYTLAFLANVNPEDGPVTYTTKGILGGYTGYYNIDPYYINAAQYNNSESRDIWEYDIELSKEEIDFFMKHLWEVSLNTGFPYYFLDENCAYYLLTLLQAVDKRFSLKDIPQFFHPIEAVKMLPLKKEVKAYRSSIKKNLAQKLKMMNSDQYEEYKKVKKNPTKNTSEDPLVLDALIDHIKYINYAKKLELSPKEEQLYKTSHQGRADIEQVTSYPELISKENPALIHSPSKLSVFQNFNDTQSTQLEMLWGYHGLNDKETGNTHWSFIEYLGAQFEYTDSQDFKLSKLTFVDIYALNPYRKIMPETSWRLSAQIDRDCSRCMDRLNLKAVAGYGVSQFFDNIVLWQFVNYQQLANKDQQLGAVNIELGSKLALNNNVLSLKNNIYYLKSRVSLHSTIQYNYFLTNNFSSFLKYEFKNILHTQQKTSLGLKFNF